jgi:putative ABC transport system permease protein
VAISAAKGSLLVGLGTLVTLVGVIVFSPVLAGPVGRFLGAPLPPMFGTVGRLAVDNASRQPRRSAATASALMIGLALVSALTIFAASATASVNAAIDRVIGAEFTISTQAQQPFPRTIADQVSKLSDVAVVSRSTFAAARVDIGTKESETFLVTVDPHTVSDVLTLNFTQGNMSDLGKNGVILDTNTAKDAGLAIGDQVRLTFATGKKTFTVVGLYETAGFFSGYIISNDGLRSAGVNIGDAFVYVKGAEGANLEALKGQIEDILKDYPGVQVQSQAELKQQFQSNVNLLLGLMVGLLGLAIFIAVLGIINTLFLSVLERTREIGMLRAVGTSRRQVRRMVVLESVLIALLGAVLGVILGVVFAISLQRTLAPQGVDVLRIPWIQLVIFLVIAMIVGALAALWPARRAARLDVLRAITTE